MHLPFLEALQPATATCSGARKKELRSLEARPHSSVPRFQENSRGGTGNRFSIRVGDHHRAIGGLMGDVVEWVWIGSHEDYNKLI
jgi:hypothetical protein